VLTATVNPKPVSTTLTTIAVDARITSIHCAPTQFRATMLVPAKTPVIALTIVHTKFVKFRMAELPVLNPWSRIF
jgi:hypothetical protein